MRTLKNYLDNSYVSPAFVVENLANCRIVYIVFPRQLSQCYFRIFSFCSADSPDFFFCEFIVPSVSVILCVRNESAIIWLVVSVVVYSINFKPFLPAVSHCEIIERLKIFFPFIAYLNSSSAVVFIFIMLWVVASLYYASPNFIERMLV